MVTMYELEVNLVCWIITAKKIAFYLVIIFALLFYFLEACFPFFRILSWQAQQTLAQKSEPGREPAPGLTPAQHPRVWASTSSPP